MAEQKPEKLERAAVGWFGRLCLEAPFLSLPQSQLALGALASQEQHDRWFKENVEGVIPGVEQEVVEVHAVHTP